MRPIYLQTHQAELLVQILVYVKTKHCPPRTSWDGDFEVMAKTYCSHRIDEILSKLCAKGEPAKVTA